MRIVIIIVAVVAVAGGLIGGGAWWLRGKVAAGDAGAAVRVERVERGEVVEIVTAPGQIQPRTKVSISARVSARIAELPFEEGDVVTKGDEDAQPPVPASVLVRLDSKDLEAALKSTEARRNAEATRIEVAKAQISAAEARLRASAVDLADAERDLRRQKQLFESHDVSQAIVEAAQAKTDGLRAQYQAAEENLKADRVSILVMQHQLEAAEADIARARDALSYTTIRSPIDGVVTRLNAKVGELVVTGTMNNAGTVIMEVADLSQMLLEARVDETVVPSVKAGQEAVIRMQAYGDETFAGTVKSVALASTDERDGSKYYETEILLHGDGRRIPSGLTADVEIKTRHHAGAMRVPSQAVLGRPADGLPADIRKAPEIDPRKTTATVVYRLINGKAVVTPVRIGASDLTHTIVESGLSEDDLVITGPYKALETMAHDQAVKVDGQIPATQPATQPSTQPATQPAATQPAGN